MKKFLRKLFSPIAFTAFLILIEVLLLITFANLAVFGTQAILSEIHQVFYYVTRGLLTLLEIIFFLFIVNKRENPEYKIPWIALIAFFPLTAMILYLFFANQGLRVSDNKIYKETNKILKEKFDVDEENKDIFREEVPLNYRGVFKYLRRVTHLHNSRGNHVTYYKCGEQFFPDLVESLKRAKKFILLEFFIIGEGKWWSLIEEVLINKAKEGVDVKLLYDDVGSFGLVPSRYFKKLRKLGIDCYKFHPLRPIISATYNNRDHRKIAVIDHLVGYTGGMNLADEYANDEKRFGYWKDTMVKIEGDGIRNLIAIFLQNYDLCTHKICDYNHYLDGDDFATFDDDGYIYAFGDGPGKYSDYEPVGEQNYINIINQANRTLYISSPYFIPTYRILEAIKSAAKRRVEVKLFLPGIPDKKIVYWMGKTEFGQLLKAGVKIYIYTPGFNHEKQMVADDILAFCGTINLDFRSLTHHFECGMTMYNVPCIKDMVEDFKEMEKVSQKVEEIKKLNIFQSLLVAGLRLFRAMF